MSTLIIYMHELKKASVSVPWDRYGAGIRAALLGAGGPGEERTHGCGAGQPSVRVGRLHGEEKHTNMSPHLLRHHIFTETLCIYSSTALESC